MNTEMKVMEIGMRVISVFLVLLVLSLCVYMGYTALQSYRNIPPIPNCSFNSGDIVKSKLGSHKGQIIRRYNEKLWRECLYVVRFSSPAIRTNTHLFGADGAISSSPLMTVYYVEEYELERL